MLAPVHQARYYFLRFLIRIDLVLFPVAISLRRFPALDPLQQEHGVVIFESGRLIELFPLLQEISLESFAQGELDVLAGGAAGLRDGDLGHRRNLGDLFPVAIMNDALNVSGLRSGILRGGDLRSGPQDQGGGGTSK